MGRESARRSSMALVALISQYSQILLDSAFHLPISLKLIFSTLGPLGIYIISTLIARLHRTLRSPLRSLCSPPLLHPFSLKTIFFGHLPQLRDYDYAINTERWIRQYGRVIRYCGVLGENRLLTTDLKAIAHIQQKSQDYHKLKEATYNLARLVGPGVLVTEGVSQLLTSSLLRLNR